MKIELQHSVKFELSLEDSLAFLVAMAQTAGNTGFEAYCELRKQLKLEPNEPTAFPKGFVDIDNEVLRLKKLVMERM